MNPLRSELNEALFALVEHQRERLDASAALLIDQQRAAPRWLLIGLGVAAVVMITLLVVVYRLLRSLAVSEARYQTTFQNAPIGIAHVGLDNRWLMLNERYGDLLGREPDTLVGQELAAVTHPDDAARDRACHAQLISGQRQSCAIEKRHIRPDGTETRVLQTLSLLRSADDTPLYYIAVAEDVTRLIAAEEAHARSEERFHNVLQHAPIPIIVYASDLGIVHVNEAWTEATGYTRQDLPDVGTWTRLAYRESPEEMRYRIRSTTADRQLGTGIELPVWTKQGKQRVFLMHSSYVGRTADGRELRMTAALDVTARKQAEAERERLVGELRETLVQRDEFLSIAAHELRTPLTPLQLLLSRLVRQLERAGVDSSLTERAQKALGQTHRLGELVETLLDVSNIVAGRLTLQRDTVDLAELVREVAGSYAAAAERAGSELVLDVDDSVSGHWDRDRLAQALGNLLDNALKYGAGSPIELRLDAEGHNARLSVRDSGIGIDTEAQQRIFDRFERAASLRHYGGLGVGLYVTRQIIEAHGGRIDVRSTPELGTLFSILLPRDWSGEHLLYGG